MKDNQRVVLTKRLLKEGLLHLLKEKPLDKITVSELCAESDINRSTFYRHYELPRDILTEMEQNLVKNIPSVPMVFHDVKEAQISAEIIFKYLYLHSHELKILFEYKTDQDFALVIDEFYKKFLEATSNISSIKNLDADSTKLLSTYCAGGIFFLLRQWISEDIEKTPKELVDLIFRFISKEV